jgi:hypothetical protein
MRVGDRNQTPAAASQVNIEKAQAYFSGPPNFWTREMVEENYRPLKDAGTVYADKPFDPYTRSSHRTRPGPFSRADTMASTNSQRPHQRSSESDLRYHGLKQS